jgi:hypothetical protein
MSNSREFFSLLLPALLEDVPRADDNPAREAGKFLEALQTSGTSRTKLSGLFGDYLERIPAEFDTFVRESRPGEYAALFSHLRSGAPLKEAPELLWALFFPEALHLSADPEEQISRLREKRTVTVQKPAADPVDRPAQEILFTSNALLTLPLPGSAPSFGNPVLQSALRALEDEPQRFWYDHPVPLGVEPAGNEVLYGLKGMSRAAAVERERGLMGKDGRLRIALSVSVTHEGLRPLAGAWLKEVFASQDQDSLAGIEVWGFTEDDTGRMIDLLEPFFESPDDRPLLQEVFGVDGEYGRHYSFLKALPALWSVLGDGSLKATFKIDLDQVFPQRELIAETGMSALEHFRNPLWGAEALDSRGEGIELGMIAGALVNESDIGGGLFSPDIPWPESLPAGEDLLFYKQRPMAVSTRAEMMTRYGHPGMPDGRREALQRVHVTGGTNGIRLDSLRRHRPFTPSFIGRAEDQAYIISSMARDDLPRQLAYLHQPGLIMRHDKEAFASQAIKHGKAGSYVGDLVRTLVFSDYASFLPGGARRIKAGVDPFTGCFITPLPLTTTALRLALHLVDAGRGSAEERGRILELAGRRLPAELKRESGPEGTLARRWRRERRAWDIFYSILDRMERNPPEAPRGSFEELLKACRLV